MQSALGGTARVGGMSWSALVFKRKRAMVVDSMMNEYDSKLFDVLARSSNRTYFFASNMKKNTARWSKGGGGVFRLEERSALPG